MWYAHVDNFHSQSRLNLATLHTETSSQQSFLDSHYYFPIIQVFGTILWPRRKGPKVYEQMSL